MAGARKPSAKGGFPSARKAGQTKAQAAEAQRKGKLQEIVRGITRRVFDKRFLGMLLGGAGAGASWALVKILHSMPPPEEIGRREALSRGKILIYTFRPGQSKASQAFARDAIRICGLNPENKEEWHWFWNEFGEWLQKQWDSGKKSVKVGGNLFELKELVLKVAERRQHFLDQKVAELLPMQLQLKAPQTAVRIGNELREWITKVGKSGRAPSEKEIIEKIEKARAELLRWVGEIK